MADDTTLKEGNLEGRLHEIARSLAKEYSQRDDISRTLGIQCKDDKDIQYIPKFVDILKDELRKSFEGRTEQVMPSIVSSNVFDPNGPQGQFHFDLSYFLRSGNNPICPMDPPENPTLRYKRENGIIFSEDFKGRDFVSIDDFSKNEIDYLLKESMRFKEEFLRDSRKEPSSYRFTLMGKTVAPLFFEDSTRTDQSFQRAVAFLGGNMMNYDYQRSSVQKGESHMDTVQIFDSLRPDLIIIRHKLDGFVRSAAENSVTPIINAGDGQNQHPTQTVLDLFSILDIRGKIEGTEIIMAGDNKLGRTVHSLSKALSNYNGCKVYYVSPEGFEMPEDLLVELKNKGLEYEVHDLEDLPQLLKEVPLAYMTRIQKERFRDIPNGDMVYNAVKKEYGINLDMLEGVNPDFRILHPRPIVFEVDRKINYTSYAYYWEKQPMNGLFTRAPLIKLIVGEGYLIPNK